MHLEVLILLLFSASNLALSEKFQTISFNPDEPDDIIKIMPPEEERFDSDCDDNFSTLDLSNTGIQNLKSKNVKNPQIKCLNLQGNKITDLPSDIFDSDHLANLAYLNLTDNSVNVNSISFLDGHENLRVLVLDGNNNNQYSSDSKYAVLPQLKVLYLRNNELTSYPDLQSVSLHFPRLTHLYLSNNNIKNLYNFKTDLGSVTHMYLERNNFVFPSNLGCFGSFSNLTHLFIDGNKFENDQMYNQYYDFTTLSQLQVLSMKNCQIQSMKIYANYDNQYYGSLTTLDVSYNQLSSNEIAFQLPLLSLQNLSLSHNLLFTIPPSVMKKSLKVISLSYNQIENIESESFRNCTKLRILSLRGNKISHIDANTFSDLTNLQMLDLAENRFNSLPPYWIKKLYNLRYLNVNFNHFDAVEKLSIPRDHLLENLHLRNNTIKSLMATPLNLPLGLTIHVSPIL